mmetsp:Transcript_4276/g.10418  ORF Transcript_4276/g.10418 Transcript_4276/m.10418 type:complete len:229 (+) Transcript_4276:1247-1933(+)
MRRESFRMGFHCRGTSRQEALDTDAPPRVSAPKRSTFADTYSRKTGFSASFKLRLRFFIFFAVSGSRTEDLRAGTIWHMAGSIRLVFLVEEGAVVLSAKPSTDAVEAAPVVAAVVQLLLLSSRSEPDLDFETVRLLEAEGLVDDEELPDVGTSSARFASSFLFDFPIPAPVLVLAGAAAASLIASPSIVTDSRFSRSSASLLLDLCSSRNSRKSKSRLAGLGSSERAD